MRDCPNWMVKGDFHSTRPVWVGDELKTGYTCNVLFRRCAPAIEGRRFRLDLGHGGEDTVFFSDVWQAGGKIAYAPDARVTEAVAVERASWLWLVKRRFRFGQTHALVLMQEHGGGMRGRAKLFGLAAVKAGVCFGAALLNVAGASRFWYWLLRASLHVGVAARVLSGGLPANQDRVVLSPVSSA
jgi:succinoglycan biosynthesis protein ExoM